MFRGRFYKSVSGHGPEERAEATHQETKFVALRFVVGVVAAIPIQAPRCIDKNTPIGIVGGVRVHGIRIAKIGKRFPGADQELIFQVFKARNVELGVENPQGPIDVGLQA